MPQSCRLVKHQRLSGRTTTINSNHLQNPNHYVLCHRPDFLNEVSESNIHLWTTRWFRERCKFYNLHLSLFKIVYSPATHIGRIPQPFDKNCPSNRSRYSSAFWTDTCSFFCSRSRISSSENPQSRHVFMMPSAIPLLFLPLQFRQTRYT